MADMGYGSGGGIGAPAGGVRLYPPVQVGDLLPPQPHQHLPPHLPPSPPAPLFPLNSSVFSPFFLTSERPPEGAVPWPDRGREGSVPPQDARASPFVLQS